MRAQTVRIVYEGEKGELSFVTMLNEAPARYLQRGRATVGVNDNKIKTAIELF